MEYVKLDIKKQKKIALVAHDNMKKRLLKWIKANKDILKQHVLYGTGTTAGLIEDHIGLKVEAFKSGPMGGDQQLGAKISEGDIDLMIFFWDPLEAQPHDPDVKALLRIAVLYDIPVANNQATADFILTSPFMNKEYKRHIIDQNNLMNERKEYFLNI
ncbi:MAG: methylglyoxal synthase [Tissierella sp.]|uniref:methylglyoxal synthase n=1 Tax=Tissierella sp. TaxID=41274 RepID=UPI003F9BE8FE